MIDTHRQTTVSKSEIELLRSGVSNSQRISVGFNINTDELSFLLEIPDSMYDIDKAYTKG